MSDLVEMGLYELVMNHAPMPVEAVLARASSEHARRTYKKVLNHFLVWIERDPTITNALLIANYKGELCEYLPPARAALWLRIVGDLCQEAVEKGLFPANPVPAVAMPAHSPEGVGEVPGRDEAQVRISTCRRDTECGLRTHLLCLLVLNTDLSPEEIRALRVVDLQKEGDEYHLAVHRGGSAPRKVALPAEVAKALNDHLSKRDVADDSPLLLRPCPNPLPPPRYARWPTWVPPLAES